MNSKGMQNLVVTLIITLGIALLLALIVYKFVFAAGKAGDLEACRASVLLNSQKYDLPGILPEIRLQVAKINCPRSVVRIKKEMGVTDAKLAIANEMANCHYKMGGGKLIPFGDKWLQDSSTYCVICSEIKFDAGFRERNAYINDLLLFLNNTNNTGAKFPAGESYYSYITGGGSIESIPPDYEERYPTSQDHIVLYTMNKKGQLARTIGAVTGGLAGAGIAAGAGYVILALIPEPSSKVVLATILAGTAATGTSAVTGLSIGSQKINYESSVTFIPAQRLISYHCQAVYQ